VPLAVLTILFGIWPAPVLDTSAASVAAMVDHVRAAIEPAAALVQSR
jgi:NADH-quinone oxidoreductase subunit M